MASLDPLGINEHGFLVTFYQTGVAPTWIIMLTVAQKVTAVDFVAFGEQHCRYDPSWPMMPVMMFFMGQSGRVQNREPT